MSKRKTLKIESLTNTSIPKHNTGLSLHLDPARQFMSTYPYESIGTNLINDPEVKDFTVKNVWDGNSNCVAHWVLDNKYAINNYYQKGGNKKAAKFYNSRSLYCNDTDLSPGTGDCTIDVEFFLEVKTRAHIETLVNNRGGGVGTAGYWIYITTSGTVQFRFVSSSSYITSLFSYSNSNMRPNDWNRISQVWDRDKGVTYWVNGELAYFEEESLGENVSAGNFNIGSYYSNNSYSMDGLISEVRYSGSARSADYLEYWGVGNDPGIDEDHVAVYQFNDSDWLADRTGNGYDLTDYDGDVKCLDGNCDYYFQDWSSGGAMLGVEDMLGGAGSFDNSTGWTLQTGWSISGGKLHSDSSAQSSSENAYYDCGLESDVLYKVVYTISNYSGSGYLRINAGGYDSFYSPDSSNGTHIAYIVASNASQNGRIYLQSYNGDWNGSIDNLAVYEIEGSKYILPRIESYVFSEYFSTEMQENDSPVYKRGSSFLFNGSTQHLFHPSESAGFTDPGTSDFSFVAWIKISDITPSTAQVICGKYEDFNNYWSFGLTTSNARPSFIALASGSTICSVTVDDSCLSANTWHQIIFTCDRATDAKIYVDGEEKTSTISYNTSSSITADADFGVGSFANGTYYFTGQIAELAILDTFLSSSDIDEYYSSARMYSFTNLDTLTNSEFNQLASVTTGQSYGYAYQDVYVKRYQLYKAVLDYSLLSGTDGYFQLENDDLPQAYCGSLYNSQRLFAYFSSVANDSTDLRFRINTADESGILGGMYLYPVEDLTRQTNLIEDYSSSGKTLVSEIISNGDFSDSTTDWTGSNLTIGVDDYLNRKDVLRCVCDNADAYKSVYQTFSNLTVGSKYQLSFSYYIPSYNNYINEVVPRLTGGTSNYYPFTYDLDQETDRWHTFTGCFYGEYNNTTLHFYAYHDNSASYTGATDNGDVFFIKDISLKEVTNGNHGIFYNTTTSGFYYDNVRQSHPYAFTFNGTSARADFYNTNNLETNDIIISMWFRIEDSTPSSTEYIIDKWETTDGGYRLYINTSGEIIFHIDDGTDTASFTAMTAIQNTWIHLVIVLDRDTGIYSYWNGELYASDTTSTITDLSSSVITNDESFMVGSTSAGASYFDGLIGITSIYIGTVPSNYLNDIVYYNYNNQVEFYYG